MEANRVLLLEDDPLDAELIYEALRPCIVNCQLVRVDTRDDFLRELDNHGDFHLILCDYSLPQFDGLTALKLARARRPDVPLIFVSGGIGEDLAIETLKQGATDYVLKNRLDRLGPAVQRASREAENRTQRRCAEESLRDSEDRFRLLVEGVLDHAIVELDVAGHVTGWNLGGERMFGYSAEEILGKHFSVFFTAEARRKGLPKRELSTATKTEKASHEDWLVTRDSAKIWASGTITALRDGAQNLRRFVLIVRDLTVRKRLEDALRDRAQKLVEADRRKDEFLAMLAHELRNPLAPILSAVELMNRHADGVPSWAEAAKIVARQVQHMTRLLDDLLDVSRVSRDKIKLLKVTIQVDTLVDRAVESCTPLIESRGHELSVSLPPEAITVRGDADRLEQVLVNLLNNAAKYTEPGGHIWLSVEVQGREVVIRVADDGVGIAPDMLPTIFDLFAQSDRSLDRSAGGLGLGLALVRRLVDMHRGQIQARSEGPGRGSEFIVRVPAMAGQPTQRGGSDAVVGGELPAERCPTPGSDPQRILVVDDNADALEMLSALLALEGYEVHTAGGGKEAIEAAERLRPDVILLDIGLPDFNGYQVARHLRAQAGFEDTLLVAVTGYGQSADRQRSSAAGFDHHLVKPINFNHLAPLLAKPHAAVR